MNTRDRYIFYTYTRENFYGTGKTKMEMTPWLESLKKSNVFFKAPLRFPIKKSDLADTPIIPGNGHNVLGIIYMALRESVIELLIIMIIAYLDYHTRNSQLKC